MSLNHSGNKKYSREEKLQIISDARFIEDELKEYPLHISSCAGFMIILMGFAGGFIMMGLWPLLLPIGMMIALFGWLAQGEYEDHKNLVQNDKHSETLRLAGFFRKEFSNDGWFRYCGE